MQYIAGPDEMVPGTSMIISSGPVTDSRIQTAVVNSLKRDTMTDPGIASAINAETERE